jgi:hypothetical protein
LKTGVFSGVERFSPERVEHELPNFFNTHQRFILQNSRGYGYWIWKPEILRIVLESLAPEEDGVLYLDAGCTLNFQNSAAVQRFKEYESKAVARGGLFFRLRGENNHQLYTKHATLQEMNAENRLDENLVAATAFFLSNTPSSRELLSDWSRVMTQDSYSLVVDPDPSEPQHEGFVAHRHDQSLLSLLLNRTNFEIVGDETYFSPRWRKTGADFPIWATRNKSRMPFISERLPMRVLRYLEQRLLP